MKKIKPILIGAAAAVVALFILLAIFLPFWPFIVILLCFVLALLTITEIAVIRAVMAKGKPPATREVSGISIDQTFAVNTLQRAIQFPTVQPESEADKAPFEALFSYVTQTFTFIRAAETVRLNSADIFILRGSSGAGSIAFNGHIDVVPAGDESLWKHPPFSGKIDNGYLYGRGTLDMKGQGFAVFNAVENLYKNGVKFKKDIYIFMTHDEETTNNGSRAVAAYLSGKNVKLDMIVDEGGTFTDGKPFGIDKTLALIGINEKGKLDVRLTAKGVAGHSSIPPKENAIERISRAVCDIRINRTKAVINPALKAMLVSLLPHMDFKRRLVFANLWLTAPLVKALFGEMRETNAMVRTTVTPTVIRGGQTINVLPEGAEVSYSVRVNAPETTESILQYLKNIAGPDIADTVLKARNPSPISSADNAQFQTLQKALEQSFGSGTVVAPYQMVAGTDSIHYYGITDNAYRIAPFVSVKDDLDTIHSENERIELKSYYEGIKLYIRLITLWDNHA